MNWRLVALVLVVFCMILATPVFAQENPYRHAGEVTGLDIPVPLEADGLKSAGSSGIEFRGAGYTHRIGRVSIAMNSLDQKHDGKITVDGNLRRYTTDATVVEHEVYRDLVKERIILNAPATVRYSYDLALSDWVTIEPDDSRPVETRDANNTVIVTYPYTNEVTNYAKDSTIDISPDRWGNLVVYVNGEDVVVMPKPFAIDAAGQRFEMDFKLDKKAKTITVAGDLAGAKYPVTVDPTERVTNGGFETGTTDGWSVSSPPPTLTVISGGANQGNYYCRYQGNGYSGLAGYSKMFRTVDYSDVGIVSMAVKVFSNNRYDFVLSDGYWQEVALGSQNYVISFPGQSATGWVTNSATPSLSGENPIQFWTYAGNYAGIDSISALVSDPPIADFTGSPLTGTAPLTVQFSDMSTGSPTSWEWDFGDGGTSSLQNPGHTYTTHGTHTVILTVTNSDGSDTKIKPAYVMGTGGTYRVFVEGVGDYPGTGNDLTDTVPLAQNFYTGIQGSNGDTTWTGYAEHYDANAGSKYWSSTEPSAIKADDADFALFAGHGDPLIIRFGTDNAFQQLNADDIRLGSARAKWVAFASCLVLNRSHHEDMEQVFNGLHILNGFDTIGFPYSNQGTQFAQRMKGEYYPLEKIREAWKNTLINTINVADKEKYSGAWMWAEPCSEDYLPGYGKFCSAPVSVNGAYDVHYDYFNLVEV